MPERDWLYHGHKPIATVRVSHVPAGSLVTEVPLSLQSWAAVGSLFMFGTDLAVPSYVLEIAPMSGFKVYGSNWDADISLIYSDWFVLLPEGAVKTTASLNWFAWKDYMAANAFTFELLLGKLKQFGFQIALEYPGPISWYFVVRNLVSRLAVEIYRGNNIYWSNYLLLDGERYQTSLYYTPMRFSLFFSARSGNFFGSVSSGTAVGMSSENVILLTGLTPNPVMISIPLAILWAIGSFWLQNDPLSFHYGTAEGDCWLRVWAHRMLGTCIYYLPPRPGYVWMTQDCRVYGAQLVSQSGTLLVSWATNTQPILGRLVCGTVIGYPSNPNFYQAPITHVSYSAELSADSIASQGQIELAPFKLTDWTTYQWVGIPLMLYEVQLTELGRLFVGARVGVSLQTEHNVVRVSVSTADNQALLQRMSFDVPVSYDYWSSEEAMKNILARFGLKFVRHPSAPNMPLLPEWYQERSMTISWTPRLGETVLDFVNRIAQLNGWRLDWTVYGTVVAYPRWEPVGSIWHAYWPTPDIALQIADLLVSRLNLSVSDYERRNVLVLYGVDAWTLSDVISILADIEAFLDPSSDRFMPFAVPAFVKFDKPIPAEWIALMGQFIAPRLFVSPFELEFVMPLSLKVRPGDRIIFDNPNPVQFHKYEFVITRVRHEIGREYSTIINAVAFKQRS